MVVDIINKKRLGLNLTEEEIKLFFEGYLNGEVKDYQMSALLMAICINGMSDKEIFTLTDIFINSGDTLDFSSIPGIKVDKHSTGGIGDKTTLIIVPIVASLGIPVIKMSGRGLGYTGGTVDKWESISGFRTDLNDEEILRQLKDIGAVSTGQTADLVPLDKMIYELRDVTGTVSSIPLIASSIMSKKIASGADKILIDVKVGKGALLQSREDALKLSELSKKIGKHYNREVRTLISDMDVPLGRAIGNSLEVKEAMLILNGKGKDTNLFNLCVELASEMVSMGKDISRKEAKRQVEESIESGSAYNKFLELVKYQGGNIDLIEVITNKCHIRAEKDGVITSINALEIGKLAVSLGAGREYKEDSIIYGVGIYLKKLVGDVVRKGDILADVYYEEKPVFDSVDKYFKIK